MRITVFAKLVACLFLGLAGSANAVTISGEIESVNAKAGTLTISKGSKVSTLRFRPTVNVTLNGQRATATQIRPGMTVVADSNEPGVASALALSGIIASAAPKADSKNPGQATVFESIESIAAVVPETVDVKSAGKANVVAVDQANEAVKQKAKGKTARLRFKVHTFEPYKDEGFAYRMMAEDSRGILGGSSIGCRVWAYFRADQTASLAQISKGKTVTVEGLLRRADVRIYGDVPVLSIDLSEAKVVNP